jgi:prepilin-type N-terminal cleavage/methylation domain-containing protein
MALHKISVNKRCTNCAGFTLLEVLVVMGLVTLILGATLFFDVNSYRGDAFRAERTNLVTALQTARANALDNINQAKHGVAINPNGYNGYVIFEGDNYTVSNPTTRVAIPASYPVTLASTSPQEVVFAQLSGDTGFSGQLMLIDNERYATSTININYEGKIGW